MKKGFDRLRGVATASVMGLGCLVAGSGRAASTSLPVFVTSALAIQFKGVNATGSFDIRSGGKGIHVNEFSVLLTNAITTTKSSSRLAATFVSTTPSGAQVYTNTRITDGTITTYTTTRAFTDAFDNVLHMSVDGNVFANPDATVDLTNNVLTSDVHTDIVAGIDAKIEYAFDFTSTAGSLGLVRALYTLINTSGAEISTTVNIGGNLGSDNNTTIQASSSGDLVSDDTDMWTYSNERPTIGKEPQYDPGLVITRYGSGASVVPTQTVNFAARTPFAEDKFANDYVLTIPAGETRRIMVFIEAHSTNAGAIASAANFETLAAASAANHLTGLSATQLAEIVNFGADADLDGALDAADNCPADANADQADADGDGIGDVCDPTDDTPAPATSGGGGSFSIPGMTALLGMLAVLRLRRRTKE